MILFTSLDHERPIIGVVACDGEAAALITEALLRPARVPSHVFGGSFGDRPMSNYELVIIRAVWKGRYRPFSPQGPASFACVSGDRLISGAGFWVGFDTIFCSTYHIERM